MTNYEQHNGETAAQMADAFIRQYDGPNVPCDVAAAFAEWAMAKAESEEEQLPCPFCGGQTECDKMCDDAFRVICQTDGCYYCGAMRETKAEAIAAHNRVARAVANAEGGEA